MSQNLCIIYKVCGFRACPNHLSRRKFNVALETYFTGINVILFYGRYPEIFVHIFCSFLDKPFYGRYINGIAHNHWYLNVSFILVLYGSYVQNGYL